VLFVLPWLDTAKARSLKFRPITQACFWVLVADVILLGFCGASPPEGIWVIASQVATLYYFAYFLVLLPVLGKMETPKPLPASISESVLKGGGATKAHAAATHAMEKA